MTHWIDLVSFWCMERHAALMARLARRNAERLCTILRIDDDPRHVTVVVCDETGEEADRVQRIRDYVDARGWHADTAETWQHAKAGRR